MNPPASLKPPFARHRLVLGALLGLALGPVQADDARLRALEQRLLELEQALAAARLAATAAPPSPPPTVAPAASAAPAVLAAPAAGAAPVAAAAGAGAAPAPASSPGAPPAPAVRPTPDGGLALVDPARGHELRFSAMVQLDGRLFLDGAGPGGAALDDGFLLRRVRPTLSGQFAGVGFRIAPELSGNGTGANVALLDAFADVPIGPTGFLRIGKQKSAISLDRLRVATALPLVERGLANELAPNRDLGLAWNGQTHDGRLQFVLGLFNGAPDGRDVSLRDDAGKEVHARIFLEPFRGQPGPLAGLGVGLAATLGRKKTSEGNSPSAASSLPRYRSAGQEEFFAYAAGVVADGEHRRLFPQLSYFHRNVGVVAEYGISEQVLRREAETRRLRHTGHDITLSWVPTGQPITFRGVQLGRDGRPALELGLRMSGLRIDPEAFEGGRGRFANPDLAARRAHNLGLGLNWHLNRQAKWSLDFNRTRYDGGAPDGGDRPAEEVVMGRFQLVY